MISWSVISVFLEPVFFTIVGKLFFLHSWSNNQLSCGILRKIFMMQAGDYERIINYDWPKTKFFQRNKINTNRNDVNKQNRYTKHLEKDNIGRSIGGRSNYEPGCFWILFFDSAREASKGVDTFLNLIFNKKQLLVFLRKYFMLKSSKVRMFHLMYLTFCRK